MAALIEEGQKIILGGAQATAPEPMHVHLLRHGPAQIVFRQTCNCSATWSTVSIRGSRRGRSWRFSPGRGRRDEGVVVCVFHAANCHHDHALRLAIRF